MDLTTQSWKCFALTKMDGLVLFDLSKDDLAVMGISALGDHKKLQQLISSLKGSNIEPGPYTAEYRCSMPSQYDEQYSLLPLHESYQCSSDVSSLCDGSPNVSSSDMEDRSLSTERASGKCTYYN